MRFYLHLILKQKNKTSKEASSTKKKKTWVKNVGKVRSNKRKQNNEVHSHKNKNTSCEFKTAGLLWADQRRVDCCCVLCVLLGVLQVLLAGEQTILQHMYVCTYVCMICAWLKQSACYICMCVVYQLQNEQKHIHKRYDARSKLDSRHPPAAVTDFCSFAYYRL